MKLTTFAELIEYSCKKLGITQTELASRIGITPTYLSLMKKGGRGTIAPRPTTVKKIADEIGFPNEAVWNALLGGESPFSEEITDWPYAEEAQRYPVNSSERGMFVIRKAFEDEGMPARYYSPPRIVEEYITGWQTDAQLYNWGRREAQRMRAIYDRELNKS